MSAGEVFGEWRKGARKKENEITEPVGDGSKCGGA